VTLGDRAQELARFVDDKLVARRRSRSMERVELPVSQYSACRARRFLLGNEPEAEQWNTGSLADIGRLAKQARTDVRPSPAHRQEGGDLDGR
jgi:hypothetical protein